MIAKNKKTINKSILINEIDDLEKEPNFKSII